MLISAYWISVCRLFGDMSHVFFGVAHVATFFFWGRFSMATQFGYTLRELRMKKGYTQEDVAKKLQIDRTTYTKYETGQSEPDLGTLKQIAKLFNVDYNTILNDERNCAPFMYANDCICPFFQAKSTSV